MSFRQGFRTGQRAGTFLGKAFTEMLDLGEPFEIDSWRTVVEDFNVSSLGFYTLIEQSIQEKCIDEVAFSRVYKSQGGLFDGKRECLQIDWGPLRYVITAAPFGTDYYFAMELTVRKDPWGQIKSLMMLAGILYGAYWVETSFPINQMFFGDYWYALVMLLATPFLLWGIHKGYWGNPVKVLEFAPTRILYSLMFNVSAFSPERISIFRAIVEGVLKGNIEAIVEDPSYIEDFVLAES